MMLDYTSGRAAVSISGCGYQLRLFQELCEASKEKTLETSKQEKVWHILEVTYHKLKHLARCKGGMPTVVGVKEAQAGADK